MKETCRKFLGICAALGIGFSALAWVDELDWKPIEPDIVRLPVGNYVAQSEGPIDSRGISFAESAPWVFSSYAPGFLLLFR